MCLHPPDGATKPELTAPTAQGPAGRGSAASPLLAAFVETCLWARPPPPPGCSRVKTFCWGEGWGYFQSLTRGFSTQRCLSWHPLMGVCVLSVAFVSGAGNWQCPLASRRDSSGQWFFFGFNSVGSLGPGSPSPEWSSHVGPVFSRKPEVGKTQVKSNLETRCSIIVDLRFFDKIRR